MNKILITLIALNFSVQQLSAQVPQKLWETFFNGSLNGLDASNSLVTDNLNNVYVTGKCFQSSSSGNFSTIKYNSGGIQQWADHWSLPGSGMFNGGKKIVIDKLQNVYAVGTVASNTGDIAVAKYNNSGKIWSHNYEPYWFGSDEDFGVDICMDTLGFFYATGQITSLNGQLWDSYYMKCDSAGTKIFDEDYSSASGDDFPTAVDVTSNGNFFAQSNSYNFFGSATYDIFTINYLNTGMQNWISKYNNPAGNGVDHGTFMKVDENSNQFICGTSDAGSNNDMVAMKQNIYGTRLWVTTYNGTANGNDTAISTTWLPNGFVVVTGKCKELHNASVLDAIVTMVIDSGTIVWTKKYYGTDSLGASPSQMITDSQGNIYICGFENLTGGTKNGCIIKYDNNGNLIWNITYDAGLNLDDKFNSLALDSNNDILLTGQTFTNTTNSNYLTVKYANSITGISDTNFNHNIKIYPNPSHTAVTISFNLIETGNVSLSIIDVTGRVVKKIPTDNLQSGQNKINIDLLELKNGIYFVNIHSIGHLDYLKFVKIE